MFTEGQHVRLSAAMEELPAGAVGIVRLADNHGNEADGVEFLPDCISVRRRLGDQIVKVIDHVEPLDEDTQEINVDAILALSAPYVQPDSQAEMNNTIRWLEAQAPMPELPLRMQAVSGFLSGLIWAIEDRLPLDRLSDEQREIIARVSSFVEQEETRSAD